MQEEEEACHDDMLLSLPLSYSEKLHSWYLFPFTLQTVAVPFSVSALWPNLGGNLH